MNRILSSAPYLVLNVALMLTLAHCKKTDNTQNLGLTGVGDWCVQSDCPEAGESSDVCINPDFAATCIPKLELVAAHLVDEEPACPAMCWRSCTQAEDCPNGSSCESFGIQKLCVDNKCGNGYVQEGEECDDANENDIDGCTRECKKLGCDAENPPPGCDPVGSLCIEFVADGGTGSGAAWSSPLGDLQFAVNRATRRAQNREDKLCHVFVAAGTYQIFKGSNTDTLRLGSNVIVAGGFAGTETSLDQRAIEVSTGLPVQQTILEGKNAVLHVVTGVANSTFDGFVVRGGAIAPFLAEDVGLGAGYYAENAENVHILNSRFEANTASYGAGVALRGGSGGIDSCTFENNTASQNGGAIFARNVSPLSVSHSRLVGNSADQSGGGLWAQGGTEVSLSDNTFENNRAVTQGAAVWLAGATQTLVKRSRFANNNASENDIDKRAQLGGALFARGASADDVTQKVASAVAPFGPLTIEESTFDGNRSVREGGAIYVQNATTVSLSDSTFTNNIAAFGSVGTAVGALAGYGGALALHQVGAATLSATNISGNTSESNGGALFVDDFSSLTVSGGSFAVNTSKKGSGGAAFVRGRHADSSVVLSNIELATNQANEGSGGALALLQVNEALYNNVSWANNTAGGAAGALHLYTNTINIISSTFTGNRASWGGGGLINKDYTSLSLSDVTFDQNVMTLNSNNGSAMLNCVRPDGTARAESSVCIELYADTWDTEVSHVSDWIGNTTWNNVALTQNSGQPVLNVELSSLDATNTTVQNNTSSATAGLYNDGVNTLWLTGGTFANNLGGSLLANSLYVQRGLDLRVAAVEPATISFTGVEYSNIGRAVVAIDVENVSLDRVAFQNYWSASAGSELSIHNAGVVNLTNTTFNSGISLAGGGCVSIDNDDGHVTNSVSFDNIVVKNCTADKNNGGGVAIDAANNIEIINSVFSNNIASLSSGGGLSVTSADTVVLTDARFLNNSSKTIGAGAYLHASTSVTIGSDVSNVSDSSQRGSFFVNNKVSTYDSADYGGGLAIEADGSTPTVSITAATVFTGNIPSP